MKTDNPFLRFFRRPYAYAVIFSLLLAAAAAFTLLETFVIPRAMQPAAQIGTPAAENTAALREITGNSYKDANISITIDTIRVDNTSVYIADIQLSGASYLKTAFADDTYGRNISETTSDIASGKNAIFAVNGDFYGFSDSGWVLRNGSLYRSGGGDTALLMGKDGNLSCQSDSSSIERQIGSLWQIWSFGPPLLTDGGIAVTKDQEISGRSSNSNPRTAIGQAGLLHYIIIVSDGRTGASEGLSLYQLAQLFQERGCSVAYNLDGGGSSTMVFNGRVLNQPTTDGRNIVERKVSDIVYIGY